SNGRRARVFRPKLLLARIRGAGTQPEGRAVQRLIQSRTGYVARDALPGVAVRRGQVDSVYPWSVVRRRGGRETGVANLPPLDVRGITRRTRTGLADALYT